MNNDIYKIYQLISFFVNKFSYQSFLISDYKKDNEIWLSNKTSHAYQLIRISNSSLEEVVFDEERINKYIAFYESHQKIKDVRFVDIHVSNEKVGINEKYNTVCINSNYYDGIDLSKDYPGINSVVHEVNDDKQEINNIINTINEANKAKSKANLKAKLIVSNPYIVTITTIILCVISYILSYILSDTYSSSSSLIFLGADYKMFTLGLGQFWRLFTYAFSHGSFLHLAMNMLALYNIGTLVEYRFGHLKTILLLVFGIVGAGLTSGVLTNNTLTIGMSGGIYALFALYLMEMFATGTAFNGPLLFTLMINIGLNFMPNVSWQAHLGGAIIGVLFSFYKDKGFINFIILSCLLIGALGVKYYSTEKISPMYGGTDSEVIEIYRHFNLDKTADKLEDKLYTIYLNDGKLK